LLASSARRSGWTAPELEWTSARNTTTWWPWRRWRGLFPQRVVNDELALTEMIREAGALAEVVTWAIDLHSCESALLVALQSYRCRA
jgi:hypothetical protein